MNHIDPMVQSLRDERLRQHKSMRGVAKQMGVSNSAVGAWENGTKSPTLRSLRKWAAVLDVRLKLEFVGFNREIDDSLTNLINQAETRSR